MEAIYVTYATCNSTRTVKPAAASVRGGVRGETIPDFHIVDPLVNGIGGAAVEIRHHDAIDGSVVDSHVGPVMIDEHLAIGGHPDAAIVAAAAVPEGLEFNPLSCGHRDLCIVRFPEYLVGQAAVRFVVAPDIPVEISTIQVRITLDRSNHAIIASGLPFEDNAPVPASSHLPHSHKVCEIRLVLEPVADVEVARFADRPEYERILGRPSSLGVGSTTSTLLDLAEKGLGRVSVMPGHGLDLIDHVIVDGRSIHGGIGDHLEVSGTAAPYVGRPSEPGDAVDADEALPGAGPVEATRRNEGGRAFKARTEQQVRGSGRHGVRGGARGGGRRGRDGGAGRDDGGTAASCECAREHQPRCDQ